MSSKERPTIRQRGMKPALARWNSPGSSFRCDKLPVAPTRTRTCEYFGPTPGGIFDTVFSLASRPEAPSSGRSDPAAHAGDGERMLNRESLKNLIAPPRSTRGKIRRGLRNAPKSLAERLESERRAFQCRCN